MPTDKNPAISVVLPCRNEELSLGECIRQIKDVFKEHSISGEIIVSDSSTDRSPEIAREHDAVLIKHNKEGYGNACLEGFKVARGKYIFYADPDGTYDFREIPRFMAELENSHDLVIGNRFLGTISRKAMPWSHRYIGSPGLSLLFRIFFGARIGDSQCGARAFKRNLLERLKMRTTGMEFASEMLVKALKNDVRIKELPINYHLRKGKSKLRTLADGFRHLRFMLLYSPLFLFLIPGLTLFLLGLGSIFWLYFGNPSVLGVTLFFHPMFLSSLLLMVGYQIIIFSIFAKTYTITHLGDESSVMNFLYKYISIEKAIFLGAIICLLGVGIYAVIFLNWMDKGFGFLAETKNLIAALTLTIVGMQTIFSSFMLSIIGIKEK